MRCLSYSPDVNCQAAVTRTPAAQPHTAQCLRRPITLGGVCDVRRIKQQPFTAAHRRCSISSAASAAAEGASAIDSQSATGAAAALLKTAADKQALVPKGEIFKALKALDKAKLKGGKEWEELLGGDASPGKRWRLIYTVDKKELERDRKGEAEAQGKLFPLTAAQRWDAGADEIENGVFLGHVASLTFKGPYGWQKNKLAFNFWKLGIKLGPWKTSFDIKKGNKDAPFDIQDKGLPFFVFFYIDEHIAVAKWRGGGWAYWRKMGPAEELKYGIV